MKAIKKSGSRDFWKLQNYLPLETRLHVKKFIGTHYFFEGKGSVTTLTKQEVISHRNMMMKFLEEQHSILDEKEVTKSNDQPVDDRLAEVKVNGELNHDEE